MKTVIQRAVTVDKARQIATHGNSLLATDRQHSMPSSGLRRGQSVSAVRTGKVNYELGKTYGQFDADKYYGGFHGGALCFVSHSSTIAVVLLTPCAPLPRAPYPLTLSHVRVQTAWQFAQHMLQAPCSCCKAYSLQ